MSVPLVEGRALAVGYRLGGGRELRLLDQADFTVEAGELVCLLGPNGCGKSTLLRTIAGMQRPLAGSVRLDGADVASRTPEWLARHLSVVLTEPVDAGALTARELVALGRYPHTDWLGRLTEVDRERVDGAIAAVDAVAIAGREVRSLSDGERQRVLVARALAQDPALMVLDEPTAHLDLPRRIETMGLLLRLVRGTGVSVLLSTHHLELALDHADRVWLLPPGGPLAIGAPEDLALSGALERTFHSDRLAFDPGDGSFRLRREPASAAVTLEGEGLARRWTERALRREGVVALDGDGAGATPAEGEEVAALPRLGSVRILTPGGGGAGRPQPVPDATASSGYRFELERDGERTELASLHQLVLRLRTRPAPAPRARDPRAGGRR